MSLSVSVFAEQAQIAFDSLPVAKIVDFPFAQGHFLPYSQARFAVVQEQALRVRLTAFEVGGPSDSAMSLLLAAPGAADGALLLTVRPGGGLTVLLRGQALAHPAVTAFPLDGEDLQGEFWGADLYIPRQIIRYVFPSCRLTAGETLGCNVLKHKGGEPEAFGCLFVPNLDAAGASDPSVQAEALCCGSLTLTAY